MSFLLYFAVRGGGSGGSHEKEVDMRGLRERRTNGVGGLCAVRRTWQRRSEDGAIPRRGYLFPSKKVRAKDSISSQIETSRFVRSLRDRGATVRGGRKRRRFAIN